MRRRLELVGARADPALAENVAGTLRARGVISAAECDAAHVFQSLVYGVVGKPFCQTFNYNRLLAIPPEDGMEPVGDDQRRDARRMKAFRDIFRELDALGSLEPEAVWNAYVLQQLPPWFGAAVASKNGVLDDYAPALPLKRGTRLLANFFGMAGSIAEELPPHSDGD